MQKWNLASENSYWVLDNEGHSITDSYDGGFILKEDATLVAAAPELLDRLQECLGYLEADQAPQYFIDDVKAAIKKAKGE